MPLVLGCFSLVMPRVVLIVVWLFSSLLEDNYATILWPIAGLVFAPMTTLAYAYGHQRSGGPPSGLWFALVIVAVLLDLGLLRSSRRRKEKN